MYKYSKNVIILFLNKAVFMNQYWVARFLCLAVYTDLQCFDAVGCVTWRMLSRLEKSSRNPQRFSFGCGTRSDLVSWSNLGKVGRLTLYAWHIKTAEQWPLWLYSNAVIGTVAVDGWAAAPPSPVLAVPNVTAHPSTASVPTSYHSMWHYNCL